MVHDVAVGEAPLPVDVACFREGRTDCEVAARRFRCFSIFLFTLMWGSRRVRVCEFTGACVCVFKS